MQKSSTPSGKATLIPPDINQCQAEKPNGHTFMTLGGSPGMERCTARPVCIAIESKPAADGLQGSMSLCESCKVQLMKQLGPDFCVFAPLPVPEGERTRGGEE